MNPTDLDKLANTAPNADPQQKDAIERVLMLYRERLQLQAEMQDLQARMGAVDTGIRDLSPSVADLPSLLGYVADAPAPGVRQYIKNTPARGGDKAPDFTAFMRANVGKELSMADFKEKLGPRYGVSTISGNLSYYKKKGIVKNTGYGKWLIAKEIPVK